MAFPSIEQLFNLSVPHTVLLFMGDPWASQQLPKQLLGQKQPARFYVHLFFSRSVVHFYTFKNLLNRELKKKRERGGQKKADTL